MTRFALDLCYDPGGGLAPDPDAAVSDTCLRMTADNLHPPLRVHDCAGRTVVLIGNPIADDKRDDRAVLAACQNAGDDGAFFASLNGSFLIVLYCPETRRLVIGNDRFASLAFYYSVDGARLDASLSAKALFDRRQRAGTAKPDPDALFEFVYFRRLFGENTFDPGVRYLRSASFLTVGPDATSPAITTYWRPDYGAPRPSDRELPDRLATRLRHAVRIATSDQPRTALLLSGGLDSRAILAAADAPLPCITTALEPNNEVAVAAAVAAAAGASHRFIPRPAALYDDVLDDITALTGSMQIYGEAQFMGYGAAVGPDVESLLIGLGFDIFFGGLYLPKDPVMLFGRPALHHRLRPLSNDIAGDFMAGVKYRLRTSDPFSIVKDSAKDRLREALRHAVDAIIVRGRALGAEGYDLWEYLHLHNLSRHYSFPMMASIRSFADCRAPALENGLFDLAIAMTARQKLDGTAYQRAISTLNPAVMRVRNANTNVRASYPLKLQTGVKAIALLGNSLFGTRYPQSPGWQARSWPSPRASLAANTRIWGLAQRLPQSEALADLGFIDMDAVGRVVDAHRRDEHDHATFLNVLLTIDRFLRAPADQPSAQTQPRRSAAALS